ncbi:MAG: hypothetical protein ACRDOY_11845 [Nocardioidaceae bacterium]
MPPPRDRSKSTRRRIAGERSRLPVGAPSDRQEQERRSSGHGGESTGGPSAPATRPSPSEQEPITEGTETTETTDSAEPTRWTVSVPAAEGDRPPHGPADGPPRWVLLTLAGLLVVALLLDAFVVWRWFSQRSAEEAAARALHSAVVQAPAVAEKAGVALLSYRYDTIDQDVAEARRYLTEEYRPKYTSSIQQLVAAPAADIQATVKANVLSSGVVEASGQRSDVLLFVNQTTTSASGEPKTALNRVVVTMVRRDGRWLVHEIRAL